MARRFQFSLRTLLALPVALCVGGGLTARSLRQYVEAAPDTTGQAIVMDGRFVELEGPLFTGCGIRISHQQPNGDWVTDYNKGVSVERHGLWSYPVRRTLEIDLSPGEYKIQLLPFGRAVVTGRLVVPAG